MKFEPVSLIKLLESCHVQLQRDGSNIRYRAPQGFTTEEVRAALIRHKPALLPLLPAWEGNFDACQ